MKGFFSILILLFCSVHLSAQDDGRFIRSNLYPEGAFEVHVFNNYYSQIEKLNQSESYNSRYDFFTVIGQFLYGLNDKLNIGFDINFRSVNQNLLNNSERFQALKFQNEGFKTSGYSRVGFSTFGPKIKYQIFPKLGSFSAIHTLLLPIAKDLGGNQETGYLDWGSPVLTNQIYYDKILGSNWSVFAETGLFIENINSAFLSGSDGFYQFSVPSTAILNYYPGRKSTIYGLLSYASRWENLINNGEKNVNYNPYYQFGLGVKYWVSSKVEMEILLTGFEDGVENRTASTFNLGIRYFSNR